MAAGFPAVFYVVRQEFNGAAQNAFSNTIPTKGGLTMHPILAAQLADDYCCTVDQVQSPENTFSVISRRPGQRGFDDPFRAACVDGKLLVAGSPEMVTWCRERYAQKVAAWFMEFSVLRALNERLNADGLRIAMAHPFFLPAHPVRPCTDGFTITWYEQEEIGQFRGDGRFGEAYAFLPDAPDVLGVSASIGGELCAMAGASRDSARMWQIGIDVLPAYRRRGLGSALTALLAREVERRGALPFYGTSMSHIASQRVALRAGFEPAWTELYAERMEEHKES